MYYPERYAQLAKIHPGLQDGDCSSPEAHHCSQLQRVALGMAPLELVDDQRRMTVLALSTSVSYGRS